MLILGIESSCDETGAAIIKDGRYLLSNVVASQAEIHDRYGGVVPEVASRQQLTTIIPVLEMALEQAGCGWENIDAVAATFGPGLAGSLLVGLTVGKAVAMAHNLPFLGVNHLEAHIYANWLRGKIEAASCESENFDWEYQEGDPIFPLICLVISGAHSELVLVRGHGQYELLGRTRDDAVGEAFDKVARVLGLSYPGGPAIQRAATEATTPIHLPRAWLPGTFDFSFSGVKTAVLHAVVEMVHGKASPSLRGTPLPKIDVAGCLSHDQIANVAAGFQASVIDVLVAKTKAAFESTGVASVAVVGGVSANAPLRERMQQT